MSKSPLMTKAIDAINAIDMAVALNDAVFMAAHAINDDTHSAAIMSVSDEISRKLIAAGEVLEGLREALK